MFYTQGQSVEPLTWLMVLSTDHLTGATGAAPTVTLSKNGGADAPPVGAVVEVGTGKYKIVPNVGDFDTLGPLWLHATAPGADPVDKEFKVISPNLRDIAAMGLTRLDTAISSRMATFTLPTNFAAMLINAAGQVAVQGNVKKNQALPKFGFVMTDFATHAPVNGRTITSVQRMIDGGPFGTGTLANVTDTGQFGVYTVDFGAGDLSGGVTVFVPVGVNCDIRPITIVTTP